MPQIGRNVCCSDECKEEKKRLDSREWHRKNVHEKTEQKKICIICGKEFTTTRDAKCCSKECRDKRNVQKQSENYERKQKEIKKNGKKKKQLPKTNHEKIADIAIAARKEGLTYGQYVAKYMGKF